MARIERLYDEHVLAHHRNPHHADPIRDRGTRESTVSSLFCGDDATVWLHVRPDGRLNVAASVRGCALSRAAASMMAEVITGQTVDEARSIAGHAAAATRGEMGSSNFLPARLRWLTRLGRHATRAECALLAWRALIIELEALDDEDRPSVLAGAGAGR